MSTHRPPTELVPSSGPVRQNDSQEIAAQPPMPKPERLIRLHQVEEKIGMRKSTIYSLMGKSAFPLCISLSGRAVAWQETLVDAWIASRIAASTKDQPAQVDRQASHDGIADRVATPTIRRGK